MADSTFPKIFAVILNFNGKNTLLPCLSSVFQSDYPNLEIVVVDNDSRDGSFEQAKDKFSRCHFIKNSANVGFSKGNNVGIRYALEKFADHVFVLNNDTIIEKNTLSVLAKTASTSAKTGIVSPLIMGPSKEDVWFAGGKIEWKKMKTIHLTNAAFKTPYLSEYLSGCAMLIKKDVFKKIGLFDERFFLYYEDADFSLRAKDAGFDLLLDPNTKIQHLEQSNQANPMKIYWLVLSGLLFFKIHASGILKLQLTILVLLRKIKNLSKRIFTKDPFAKKIHQAFIDFKKIK